MVLTVVIDDTPRYLPGELAMIKRLAYRKVDDEIALEDYEWWISQLELQVAAKNIRAIAICENTLDKIKQRWRV